MIGLGEKVLPRMAADILTTVPGRRLLTNLLFVIAALGRA